MTRLIRSAGLGATLLLAAIGAGAAQPVALTATRVGGMDVAALAKFYEAAFGLKETRRLELPQRFDAGAHGQGIPGERTRLVDAS